MANNEYPEQRYYEMSKLNPHNVRTHFKVDKGAKGDLKPSITIEIKQAIPDVSNKSEMIKKIVIEQLEFSREQILNELSKFEF